MHNIWAFIPTQRQIIGIEYTLRINVWVKAPLTKVAVYGWHSGGSHFKPRPIDHPTWQVISSFLRYLGMVSKQRARRPKNRASIPKTRNFSLLESVRLALEPNKPPRYCLSGGTAAWSWISSFTAPRPKLGLPPRAQGQHTLLPGKYQRVLQTKPRSFLSISFQPIIN
jgi:hypothetical protein